MANYFVGGALTSYGGNPVLTIIEIDEEHLVPVIRKVYAFDLNKANKDGSI